MALKPMLLAVAAGTALLATGVLAQADWAPRAPVIETKGNLTFHAPWNPERGLKLRLATADTNGVVELDLRPGGSQVRFLSREGLPEHVLQGVRVAREALPATACTNLELVLKIRPGQWSLYGGGRRAVVLPAPFRLPLLVLQESGPAPAGKARFQKVADFRFDDSFMRPEEDENPLGEWEPLTGTWYLHTALDTARDQGTIKPEAKRVLKSDFSPNFYSMAATGAAAVITSGYDFYDNYTYEAGLRTAPGEMGLLFYGQESGSAHGFTLAMDESAESARLILWAGDPTNRAGRTVLGDSAVGLTEGQWVKLGVKVVQDRIQCFFDHVKVLDLPADLPPGGRFGLFADSPDEVRFDDIAVCSTHDLDFRNVADLRQAVLEEKGAMLPRRSWFRPSPPEAELTRLEPAVSDEPQWLAVGSPADGPHVFAADFEVSGEAAGVGLMAGFTGSAAPHYRFVCRRTSGAERFTLESVSTGAVAVLEELTLPREKGSARSKRVSLMVDATPGNEWRLYRNGRLVLVHAPAPEAVGGSGLFVDAKTKAAISVPRYQFKRDDVYLNRYEKNEKYTEDPFMRHWASPEGQWLEETNRLTWYTGDFFGRHALRMPAVEQSQIHLGVGEGETNGALIVTLRNDALHLSDGADTNRVLASSPTNAMAADGDVRWYVVNVEDHWVWATSGDRLLFKHALPKPMTGRRVRVAGFTTEQLKATHVDRYQVKDFLFTESMFDWVANGGRWEIINRFNCDPRWSHMNGESSNTLAAIWAKYEIRGDFCIEMFAGQRHGWYERCGDMNMTVMSRDTTPSQGYTITCTGWDPDHSQLMTRLYRNGKVIAESDKYLVPRKREGNKRLGYEPLVAAGRDVHGAWYYLKFRRIGGTLEFYFDNELVFRAVDDQPLDGGLTGIWTFMNSMMVARVKVAAESIRPRLPKPAAAAAAAPAPAAAESPLLADGRPAAPFHPRYWEAADTVGLLKLEWHADAAGPWFSARNAMGSGNMAALCALPPAPFERLAGWRFEVKRSPHAQFDFHYAVGRTNATGEFVPEQRFVHRLSGSGLEKGEHILGGSSDVKPGQAWTPVTVWVPNDWPAKAPWGGPYAVKAEGFGLLRPSFELQGLTGNAPGESYGVRGFTEITFGAPRLGLSTNGAAPSAVAGLSNLQARLDSAPGEGLIRLAVKPDGQAEALSLAWVRLPATPAVTAGWHPDRPDSVLFKGPEAYPDRRFLDADLCLNGVKQQAYPDSFSRRWVPVPREASYASNPLTASVVYTNASVLFALAWADARRRDPPVLLAAEGLTPYLQNGEPRNLAAIALPMNAQVPALAWDAVQGWHLAVRNTPACRKLRTVLPVTVSLAKYPIFQFRYKLADPMARVSLALGGSRYARLSEALPMALPVRDATNLVADNTWRTWVGQVSDAMLSHGFDTNAFRVASPEIGSGHGIDQTGLYSEMALDDLVFGPAVARAEQLAFTPRYADPDGVAGVWLAVRQGHEPFSDLPPGEMAALAWQPATNDARAVPSIRGLTNGLCHLFIKARSRNGRESAVTDVPFLLDTAPLKTQHAFGSPDITTRDGSILRLVLLSDGAAPPDPEPLTLKWNGKQAGAIPRAATLVHQPEQTVISFTWPQVFRDQLATSSNGQQVVIGLGGLVDGAGNPSPDLSIPFTIDYAKDKTPPILLPVSYPTNIGFRTGWEVGSERLNPFVPRQVTSVDLVHGTNEPPYLAVKTGTDGIIAARFERGLEVKPFPFLAMRIRRPVINPTNDADTLNLAIELSTTNTLTVPLIPRKPNPRYVALPEPPVWQSNTWASIFVDVWQEAVNRGFSDTNLSIKSLTLRITGKEPANQFHLQSVYTFGRGTARDVVRLNAYDASGLDVPRYAYENVAGQVVEPAAFVGALPSNAVPPRGWAVVYARDKAGNETLPLRIPVWSLHPPIGAR